MWIRLSDILQPTEFRESIAALVLDMGYHYEIQVGPTELQLAVAPTREGHRLIGGFSYEASAPCTRCLKPVPFSGQARFDLEYKPARLAVEEEDVEATEGEPEVVFYEDETLPLKDLVIQQMYLEIPDKTLCRETCKGLCPSCGADLNEGACPCPPLADARWGGLSPFTPPKKES